MIGKSKLGRPKLPDSDRRDQQFMVKLTPAERQLFDRAAVTSGTTPMVWARDVLLRAARRRVKD